MLPSRFMLWQVLHNHHHLTLDLQFRYELIQPGVPQGIQDYIALAVIQLEFHNVGGVPVLQHHYIHSFERLIRRVVVHIDINIIVRSVGFSAETIGVGLLRLL